MLTDLGHALRLLLENPIYALAPLAALAPFAGGPMARGAEPLVFPTVEGRDLEMRPRALPAAFDGHLNLVLVAFQQWQQQEVDTWLGPAGKLASRHARFRFFEVPTLSAGYSWMRGFIDGGMRRGVPDPAARARTITLYLDKLPFRRALEIPDETHITALLLDENHRIVWRTTGPFDEAKFRSLEAAIRSGQKGN